MTHSTKTNPGLGVVLQMTISSVLTAVVQVLSLDGPSWEVGQRETTNLASTNKTYAPTLPDPGEVSGTLQLDPQDPTHAAILALMTTPEVIVFAMVLTDTTPSTFTFSGFFTKLEFNGMEIEDTLLADFTIKLSGAITHSP